MRVAPWRVDDAACGENQDTCESRTWINDGPGCGDDGPQGHSNMTGSADEYEQARRLMECGQRGRSDSGDARPGTEPPKEWKGNPVCRADQLPVRPPPNLQACSVSGPLTVSAGLIPCRAGKDHGEV